MHLWNVLKGKISTTNFRPGIRGKVILIVLGVTIVLTLFTMAYLHTTLRDKLAEQLDHKSVSISRNVAARGIDHVLTNNMFELHKLAYDTMENNDDVIYVMFLDDERNLMAHTFQDYFPPDLLDIEHEISGEDYNLKKFQSEKGILRDIAVPVFPGTEGDTETIARVGVIDHSVQSALSTATQQLISIAAVIFIVVSFLVYLITTYTTIKPINSLLSSVQAVAQGDLSRKVQVKSKDELNTLASAFNSMTKQLSQAQAARDRLMSKLIHSQEEERQRISRELHDETGQSLTTLMLTLRFLEEAQDLNEVKERTEEHRQLLLQTLEQVRMLAWKLTPSPLIDLGLKAALESVVNKFKQSSEWNINMQIKGLENRRLPSEIELTIYRVVQEALTNIAKHASAENVDIFLECTENKIMLVVEDDGVGFDTEKIKTDKEGRSTLGLNSMKERISLIGGKFNIESVPQEGTTLHVYIPLEFAGGDENSRAQQSY